MAVEVACVRVPVQLCRGIIQWGLTELSCGICWIFPPVLIGFTAVQSESRLTALASWCNLFHFHTLHEVPIYFRRAIQFVETIHALKQAIKSLRSVIKIHSYCLHSPQNIGYLVAVVLSSAASKGLQPALVSTKESTAID